MFFPWSSADVVRLMALVRMGPTVPPIEYAQQTKTAKRPTGESAMPTNHKELAHKDTTMMCEAL